MLTGSCHCGRLNWRFDGAPHEATICNCSVCRRYGVIWIYGYEADGVSVTGDSRIYKTDRARLEFHFCPDCGCITAWRMAEATADGRRRMAVNLRLTEDQDVIRTIPLGRYDGLHETGEMKRDGRMVADLMP
ncbi:GFA family protein [Paracoccus aurantiacus]|uniref:GFA family protein n=1 Tax=Paracoccus aurantiacus TaxID=2599412 RepID=A0A5C6RVL2_9RHOB|nr:GFA family protein [Paracoccus aurantiacus]TXB66408.1 GFA family protein [Paracoccus aurantiacus]